ncbi:DUF4296 domain-containing protein [Ferruginibacter sp.]|nr:DUF4296 domain-containing protein [Ferruginibacter sp.]
MRWINMVLISTVILFSCESKNAVPAGILKPAKMQTVLWDMLRADAFTYEFITKDSAKKPEAENVKLQQQIFTVHKISKDDFYKSYEFYKSHPDLMQTMLDSLINKATRDKFIITQAKQLKDTLTAKKIPDTLTAQ